LSSQSDDSRQVDELAAGVQRGERRALAEALNLLDDRRDSSRARSAELVHLLQGDTLAPGAHMIGMTGPPGVGKSSLGACLITEWRRRGLTVGVLAVDPSSPLSGGALLGDRLRLHSNPDDRGVFFRSLSSRGHYGGLSAEVWPMCQVMASAFDIVMIETVGVGQREIDISRMCDTTCFIAQPGSGDSIQSLKAGILEVPHILVVNKADMGAMATRTASELAGALTSEHPDGAWRVPVLSTSATQGSGISELVDCLEAHFQTLLQNKLLKHRRRGYQAYWIVNRLQEEFGAHGVERLGGEAAIVEQIQSEIPDLYRQYDALRRQLADRSPTLKS